MTQDRSQRWARMRDILGLNIKPWKKHGDYILITWSNEMVVGA